MEQKKICELTKRWIGELVNLGATQNILPLLSPDNVSANEQGITLKNKNAQGASLYLYPGYSAPEVYTGQAGEAGKVYFVGAVMYALLTGAVAPDAQTRTQNSAPLLAATSVLANVINRATVPKAAARIPTLQQLWQEVDAAEKAMVAPAPAAAAVVATAPAVAAVQEAAIVPQEAKSTAATAAETAKETLAVEKPKEEPTAAVSAPPVSSAAGPGASVQTPAANAVPFSTQTTPAATAPVGGYVPGQAVPAAPGHQTGPVIGPTGAAQQPGQSAAPYGQQQPAAAQPAQKQKKKSKKGWLIAAIVVVVLLVAGVVYTLVQSNRIDQAYAGGDYATVVSATDMTPWLRGGKQEMFDYARAQLLLQEGKLEESLAAFEELGDYENSPRLVQDIKYNLANQLLEEGKLDEALALFKEIRGYQDTNSIISDLELYMSAENAESAMDQYDIYISLGGFLDSAERAAGLAGEVYNDALERYKSGDFSNAGPYFAALGDYEDAPLYAEACSIFEEANTQPNQNNYNRSYLPRLQELSEQIDVGSILTHDKFLMGWLHGSWQATSGASFSVDVSGGSFTFSLVPAGSYRFMNGKMLNSSMETVCTFTYVSYNEMVVTMADGTEHHFTRS